MRNNRVYLYGFDAMHRVKDTVFLQGMDLTIGNMIDVANSMYERGDIRTVYAVDNFSGLKKDFFEAVKTNDFTVHIQFEDEVSRDGIMMPYKG